MKINAIGHLVKANPIQTQSNPIAERVKLMQSVHLERIMKKNAAKGYKKTKPKQTRGIGNELKSPISPKLTKC